MSNINPSSIKSGALLPVGTRVYVAGLDVEGIITKHRAPVKGRPAREQYPYAVEVESGRTLPFKTTEVEVA